jgi:biotin carboxyl carrier protein
VVASGALYLRSLQTQATTASGAASAVSSVTVVSQDLQRVFRLSGTTAALRYAELKVPQMRGGRGSSLGEVTTSVSTGARSGRGGGGGTGGANVSRMVGFSMGGGGGMNMAGRGGGPGLTITEMAAGGTIANEGDVVVRFDTEDQQTSLENFQQTVKQNRANMATFEAQLEVQRKSHALSISQAKSDMDKADLDYRTIEVRGAIEAENLRLAAESARATYNQVLNEVPLMETSLGSAIKSNNLALQESEAELKRLQANLDKMTLRAPFRGLVVVKTVQRQGSSDMAQIKVGDSVGYGQSVVDIVDTGSMVLNATVNQVNADMIKVGAKARVRLDAFPEVLLPAEVMRVGAMPSQSTSRTDFVKSIPVMLKINGTDPRLIPDLTGSADVVLETEPGTVVAPRESIFRDSPDGKPYVFVRGREGWARRDVEVGLMNYIQASIRSGLKAGEVIARERPPKAASGAQQK